MQLRPDHMRLIQESINLDYDGKIQSYYPSTEKFLLCDTNFGFNEGVHDPHKLLLTGFMYCCFENEMTHMTNLWHLINPNFKQTVSLDVIKSTIEDLLYLAIDQRLLMLDEDDENTNGQRMYLEECEKRKEMFVKKICEELQDGDTSSKQITAAKFN